jgi:site-specific DNA-cytosine methylase
MSGRTKRLKALGNAVVPDCAEWIARRILEADAMMASTKRGFA